jgi:hypothetical protein
VNEAEIGGFALLQSQCKDADSGARRFAMTRACIGERVGLVD